MLLKKQYMSVLRLELYFAFIFALCTVKTVAQNRILYNWKGSNLILREQPNSGGKAIINIPRGAAVQDIGDRMELSAFNVVLSYYGSMSKAERGDYEQLGASWYNLKGNWVKVSYGGKSGYVPDLFLSRLPDLYPKKHIVAIEKVAPAYLASFFGPPVSNKKKQLPKQTKEEINYEQIYTYKNGSYYKLSLGYAEEGGAGGEEHLLYLKGLNKHEAILLMLKLITGNSNLSDAEIGQKKRSLTKSLYDKFSWWYNKNLSKEDQNERNIDQEFYYSQEGGSETLTIKETKNGIIIAYSFGGC
jgi:hypothetical protein